MEGIDPDDVGMSKSLKEFGLASEDREATFVLLIEILVGHSKDVEDDFLFPWAPLVQPRQPPLDGAILSQLRQRLDDFIRPKLVTLPNPWHRTLFSP